MRPHRHSRRRSLQQDEHSRDGQWPQAPGSSIEPGGKGRGPDQQGGPHHRHLASHHRRIEGDSQRRSSPGKPAGNCHHPQKPQQCGRKQPDMQAGDCQNVDSAGGGKLINQPAGQLLTASQQHRGNQRLLGCRQHLPQLGGCNQPEPIHHSRRRPPGRRLNDRHGRPVANPNERQHPASPGLHGKVELTGIERGPGPQTPAEQPHPTPRQHGPRWGVDKDPG